MGRNKNPEKAFDQRLEKKGIFIRASEYKSLASLIKVKCIKNGCISFHLARNAARLSRCKLCTYKERFLKDAHYLHHGKFDYSKVGNLTSKNNKIIITCKVCGNEYQQTVRHHLQYKCKIDDCIYSTNDFLQVVTKKFKELKVCNEYDFSQVRFTSMNDYVIVRHRVCNNTYRVLAQSLKNGNTCIRCNPYLLV